VYQQCTSAQLGCVDDKQLLADGINKTLEPFRERRREVAEKPGYVEEILQEGARYARAIAKETLSEVRGKMGISETPL